MNSNEVDILENIADVLTSKFKKDLILNLQPYAERIRDGEKYQQVILKLLESLPEYVELREKYDRVVEENLKLKGQSDDSVEANITLDLSEKRDKGNEIRKIDLTDDIGVVCQDDQNLVLDESSGEETDEDRDSDKDKKTVVYKDNYLKSKFDAVDKSEKEGEEEDVEVTDDEEEDEAEEEDDRVRGDIPAEEEVVAVVEQPKVEEKPKKSGKKPTNERKVPIK